MYDNNPLSTENAWSKLREDATKTFEYIYVHNVYGPTLNSQVVQPMWLT